MKKSVSIFLVVCILTSLFAGVGPYATRTAKAEDTPVNIIPNPGFEQTVANATWLNGTAADKWGVWFATAGGVVSVDQAVYHGGQNSIKIDQTKSSRTCISVNGGITVLSGRNYKIGTWLKTQNVSTNGVIFRTYYYNGTTKIADGPSVKTTGTNDWAYKELFISVPANANNLRVEVMFETGTGIAWVDDASLALFDGVTSIKLDKSYLQLNKGEQYQLNPIFSPSNAVDKSVIWTSSNPSVVDVVYGNLTAKDYGISIIRVTTPDGKLFAECPVSVESPDDIANMDSLRQKWYDRLTGNSLYNENDPDMVKSVTDSVYKVFNENGTGRWDTLNKAPSRTYLWEDNNSTTNSAHITNSYGIIRSMALAYSYKGSTLYKNEQLKDDIISALEWMYNNRYNERVPAIYNNWWDWEIGTPKYLNDIMVLMYDDLTAEQINKYISAIDRFVPDPTKRKSNNNIAETGANLLDKAIAVTVRGIVGKSAFKVVQGSSCIGPEYVYTKKGDGVFTDGSLIQHTNIAYTGGYGSVWLSNTADMMYLLKGSKWAITDPTVNNVFQWVFDTFEPVIYKGLMMDMVNGRGISREATGSARGTILCIMRLAESAPINQALEMKRMVKEWVLSDTTVANYYEGMSLYDMLLLKAIMNDSSIAPRGELIKSQVFAGMDRVVHLREKFGFGISMFSNRISAFEYGNGENIKGWYTGMGMTYLYDEDLLQYRNDFWPTVDSYRLAGTTTDGSSKSPVAWASYYNPRNWVGGTTLNNLFSTAGMDFSLKGSTGSSLQGKKSWFNFDNEIVALGSGITGGTGIKNVETIVENRKIRDENDNTLTVNGQVYDSKLGWKEKIPNVSWAHLTGNVPNSDVGYYFPTAPSIDGLRESRTGAWSEINTTQSNTPRTKNYVSLAFDHGVNPADDSYSYVLLPGKNASETESYSKNPEIQILSNTNDVHAVRETKLGITAANFWAAGTVDFITSQNPAAVMVKEENNSLTVSVSDPTQQQSSVVIELAKEGYNVVSKDQGIEVLQMSPTIKIAVNVSGAIGATFTTKIKLVDTEAPSAPANLKAGETDNDSLVLEWEASSDNAGVNKYIIFMDGTKVGEVTGETCSYTVTGLQQASKHEFTLIAVDEVGNKSPISQSIYVKIKDKKKPMPPKSPWYTELSQTSVTLVWEPSTDNIGVTGYRISIGDKLLDTVQPDILKYKVKGLISDTAYTFKINAIDEDGNISDDSIVYVTTDSYGYSDAGSNQKPVVSDGNVKILPILDNGTKVAKSEISQEDVKKLVDTAKENDKGIKEVSIELEKVEGANGYIQSIPLEVLAQDSKDIELNIKTHNNEVLIPSKTMSEIIKKGNKSLEVSIEGVNTTTLAQEALYLKDKPLVEVKINVDGKEFEIKESLLGIKVYLDYAPTQSELMDVEHLCIVRIENDGKVVPVQSGRFVQNISSMEFSSTQGGKYGVVYIKKTFQDMQGFDWAKKEIEVMASKGIINGVSEKSFVPEENITRADLMMLIVKSLGLTGNTDDNFDDVKPEDYYFKALGIAKQYGLANGKGDNKFNPNEKITRQDMIVLIDRAMKLYEKSKTLGDANELQKFVDASSVAGYATNSVSAMIQEGIIKGDGININPESNATRAEAAVIIYRMYMK